MPPLKGSVISGDLSEGETGVATFVGVLVKGAEERSLMASVIVGWKRPPKVECFLRWVGSTCPRVKKVDRALMVMSEIY